MSKWEYLGGVGNIFFVKTANSDVSYIVCDLYYRKKAGKFGNIKPEIKEKELRFPM